jgi:hypothetical protein
VKCKHTKLRYRWLRNDGWYSMIVRRGKIPGDAEGFRDPTAIACHFCGAWLSLGPANDKGVEHEIRAAFLAAEWKPNGGVGKLITPAESDGWCGWPHRSPAGPAEEVGFLACQIHHHEQDLGAMCWAGEHQADYVITQHPEGGE